MNLQETKNENPHEINLLRPGQSKCPNPRQRQHEDYNIAHNIEDPIEEPPCRNVREANGILHGWVPHSFQRDALQEDHDTLRCTPCSDDNECRETVVAHVGDGHEPPVVQEKCHLDPEEAHHVEKDGHPKTLIRIRKDGVKGWLSRLHTLA